MTQQPRLPFAALLLLAASVIPLRAYVIQKDLRQGVIQYHWAAPTELAYQVNQAQGSNITGSRTLNQVFAASFDAWQSIPTANVSFTQGPDVPSAVTYSGGNSPDNINLLKTNMTPADYQIIAGNALGITLTVVDDNGEIQDADILFNPSVLFSTDLITPAGWFDLQSVATHEVGHLLGLDHTNILSATMYPRMGDGLDHGRALATDDRAGLSVLYPSSEALTLGSISGTVRMTSNVAVFGALVVAVNENGEAAASTFTDPEGHYTIAGIPVGDYTIYAEPMNQPFSRLDVDTLERIFPGMTPNTAFTTRFH